MSNNSQYPGDTFFGVRKNGIFNTVVASNLITSNLEQNPSVNTITCYTKFGAMDNNTGPGEGLLFYDTACTRPVITFGNLLVRSVNVSGARLSTTISQNYFYLFLSPTISPIGYTNYLTGTDFQSGLGNSFTFTGPNGLAPLLPTIQGQYLCIANDGTTSAQPGQFTVIATFY